MGCQLPQLSSQIRINAAAHRVGWKWLGGSLALSQFGDPVSGATTYHLCIYDTNASSLFLAFGARVPGGGTCGSHPCWKQNQTYNRLTYANAGATPDGVSRMTLQAKGYTKTYIRVSARGTHLRLPVLVGGGHLLLESPAAIVQLQRSDSPECWEADYETPAIHDTRSVFVDSAL